MALTVTNGRATETSIHAYNPCSKNELRIKRGSFLLIVMDADRMRSVSKDRRFRMHGVRLFVVVLVERSAWRPFLSRLCTVWLAILDSSTTGRIGQALEV